MSLLGEIRGVATAPGGEVEAAVRRLCAELLSRNRLPPAAVIAARIRVPAEAPVDLPRELGWVGIPVFWESRGGEGVEVIAHVRLKRRRRLHPVALEQAA